MDNKKPNDQSANKKSDKPEYPNEINMDSKSSKSSSTK
jgi:hypothetical protein